MEFLNLQLHIWLYYVSFTVDRGTDNLFIEMLSFNVYMELQGTPGSDTSVLPATYTNPPEVRTINSTTINILVLWTELWI